MVGALGKKRCEPLFSAATATATSDAFGLGGKKDALLALSISQSGAASTPASVDVEISGDGSTWFLLDTFEHTGDAGETEVSMVDIPDGAAFVRAAYTAQAGGSSSSLTAHLMFSSTD